MMKRRKKCPFEETREDILFRRFIKMSPLAPQPSLGPGGRQYMNQEGTLFGAEHVRRSKAFAGFIDGAQKRSPGERGSDEPAQTGAPDWSVLIRDQAGEMSTDLREVVMVALKQAEEDLGKDPFLGSYGAGYALGLSCQR